MVKKGSPAAMIPPERQPTTVLDQNNPADGIWYTVLEEKNARIYSLSAKCTWSVQPLSMEVRVTVDGATHIFSKANPTSDTWAYPLLAAQDADDSHPLVEAAYYSFVAYRAFWLEGRNVKVEARVTGGTVSNLFMRIHPAKWP